jgi:hypothetical protein
MATSPSYCIKGKELIMAQYSQSKISTLTGLPRKFLTKVFRDGIPEGIQLSPSGTWILVTDDLDDVIKTLRELHENEQKIVRTKLITEHELEDGLWFGYTFTIAHTQKNRNRKINNIRGRISYHVSTKSWFTPGEETPKEALTREQVIEVFKQFANYKAFSCVSKKKPESTPDPEMTTLDHPIMPALNAHQYTNPACQWIETHPQFGLEQIIDVLASIEKVLFFQIKRNDDPRTKLKELTMKKIIKDTKNSIYEV